MDASIVRVLIVDDYAPWRRFVALALTARPEIKIVGEGENGLTAIQTATELQPDVVTLDIGLPDIAGIEVARQIKILAPQTKIIFLTENCSPEIVTAALSTSAVGYVVKSHAASDLLSAMDAVLLDHFFISPKATEALPTDSWSYSRRLHDPLSWI
jgi:DNA-binding NarL/FixJ family response regulator